jgi:hypothetical protein
LKASFSPFSSKDSTAERKKNQLIHVAAWCVEQTIDDDDCSRALVQYVSNGRLGSDVGFCGNWLENLQVLFSMQNLKTKIQHMEIPLMNR